MEITKLYEALPIAPEQVTGLVDNQRLYEILAVTCQLEIFEELQNGRTPTELANRKDLERVGLEYLLDLLYQAGYLLKQREVYYNSPLTEIYLLENSFLKLTHFFPQKFAEDSLATQLLKALQKKESKGRGEPDWNPDRLRQIGVGSLIGSLHSTIAACDLTGTNSLLDLGGGHGFYSIAFVQKYPQLQAALFDLPQVIPLAAKFTRKFRLEERIKLIEGNFLQDEIGHGYDAVLCSNILHSDKRDVVLNKVWQALNPGGRIIVKCRVSDCQENCTAALAKLLWYLQGGREIFSQKDWYGFLAEKGFQGLKTVDLNGIFATIMGWKNKD